MTGRSEQGPCISHTRETLGQQGASGLHCVLFVLPCPHSFVLRPPSPVLRPPSFVIAKPQRGCGNPSSIQSPVSRPPSLVKPPPGIQWGGAPWSSGRESRGDRLEIGPLWRFLFPISLPLKEMGSPADERLPSKPTSPLQRAILQAPADSPLASAIHDPVPSPPAGLFLCSAQRKRRKKCAKGNRVVARVNGRYPAFGRIPARFPRLLLFKSKRFVSI